MIIIRVSSLFNIMFGVYLTMRLDNVGKYQIGHLTFFLLMASMLIYGYAEILNYTNKKW